MKIKEIRLKNFKAYENERVKFSCDNEKNVTLIYGVMGAGKTSLFEAINWCLFGDKIIGSQNTINKAIDIAGKYLNENLSENSEAEVSVEIDFEHDGADYYLSRSVSILKESQGLRYLKDKQNVFLNVTSDISEPKFYDKTSDTTIFRIINNILPIYIREYFLFDGEKLDKFSKIDQTKEIQSAIKEVLGLVDFDYAKKHLQTIKSLLSKRYGELENSDEIKQLTTIINDYELKISNIDLEKETLLNEQDVFKKSFDENEERLKSFKQEIEQIEKRKLIKQELEDQKILLKDQRKVLRDLLTLSYESYGFSVLTQATNLLDKWQKEGKFPAEYYNKDFIDKILNERKCFCGHCFDTNSDEFNFFMGEQKRLSSWDRGIQEKLTQLFGDFKKTAQSSVMSYNNIQREHTTFVEIEAIIGEKEQELKEINAEIKSNITDDEMSKCNDLHITLDREISNITKLMDKKVFDRNNQEVELKKAEKLRDTKEAKTSEGKIVKNKLDLIIRAIEYIDLLYDDYAQEKRIEIEKLTQDLFQSIFWKKVHFKNVNLTEDYRLVIKDRWDEDGRRTLSAGEREVLSLAFVTALTKSASKDAPFIIDTPFARISKEPTDNIAENLPKHLNQLILFVTDKELTEKSEKLFEDKCEYIWTIKFNDETSRTEIKVGKHVN